MSAAQRIKELQASKQVDIQWRVKSGDRFLQPRDRNWTWHSAISTRDAREIVSKLNKEKESFAGGLAVRLFEYRINPKHADRITKARR